MTMFKQMTALALCAAVGLTAGCGSEERGQAAVAVIAEARAAAPAATPAGIGRKRHGGPPQAAAASSAASAAESAG